MGRCLQDGSRILIVRHAQAKKRQLIEQRLQAKLRKETDSVRRAEDAKKDKTTANRKEEDLQLKDSLVCLVHWVHCLAALNNDIS